MNTDCSAPVVVTSLADADTILCELILEAYKDKEISKEQIDSYGFFSTIHNLHNQKIKNKDYTPIIVENTVFSHEDGTYGLFRVIVEFENQDFYNTTIKLSVVNFTEEEKLIFDKVYGKVINTYIPQLVDEISD